MNWESKFKDNLLQVLYRSDQPRDEKGRWTSGGVGVPLGTEDKPFATHLDEYSIDSTHHYHYVRNTQKAPSPDPDDTFGQQIEPAGRYMSLLPPESVERSKAYVEREGITHLEHGTIKFDNPLLWPKEGTSREWKENLSQKYEGLTGKKLSTAIKADGYDGIITIEQGHPSEVIKL